MSQQMDGKKIAWIMIILLISISLASALPMVTPPSVSTPGSNHVVSTSQTVKNSNNWEIVSASDPAPVQIADSSGARVQLSDSDIKLPEVSKNSPLAKNAMISKDALKGATWVYVSTTYYTAYWSGGKSLFKTGVFTNPSNAAVTKWKVTLTAPRTDLDLYLYQKTGTTTYTLIGKSNGYSSSESIVWNVYNKRSYGVMVKRGGGSTGTWTGTVKFYYEKASTPTPGNTEIINAHQTWRSQVGSPRLVWSSTLAANSLAWAKHNAAQGYMEHSNGKYGKVGENIWMGWPPGSYTYTQMVNKWGAEKQYYIHRPFGDAASTTGSRSAIGHYTQVVWKKSTQVGCGKASANGKECFICQYYPQGNMLGQYAY